MEKRPSTAALYMVIVFVTALCVYFGFRKDALQNVLDPKSIVIMHNDGSKVDIHCNHSGSGIVTCDPLDLIIQVYPSVK